MRHAAAVVTAFAGGHVVVAGWKAVNGSNFILRRDLFMEAHSAAPVSDQSLPLADMAVNYGGY